MASSPDHTTVALTAAELAARVRAQGWNISLATALRWLRDWQERGLVEEVEVGRFRLTDGTWDRTVLLHGAEAPEA